LAYAWAAPTTALGLLIGALTLFTGGAVERRDGCLEFHRAFARALLESPRLGASAITLGHVILGRDAAALDANRAHEHVHVRQAEWLGPFFLPLYGLAAVWAAMRHGRHYEDNWFEVEARLKSGETHAAGGSGRPGATPPGPPPT
jgi:cytochrome bd-type quinol oxidase subunit 2